MTKEKAEKILHSKMGVKGFYWESYCQPRYDNPELYFIVFFTKAGTWYSEDGEMFSRRGF
jgi:hypothetical protein